MRLIVAAFIALIVCIPSSSRAEGEVAALVAICDQAAASPLDTKRPAGVAGVPADKVDPKIAIPACETAAKAASDDPRMMFQLGRAYYSAKAYESARVQYAKADAIGYPLATNNLATLYMDGEGVLADPGRAMGLLEKAANAGLGFAMKNLGDEYLNGSHVQKDQTQARLWFLKAAEAGNADAMMMIGYQYMVGDLLKQNYEMARKWSERAAQSGRIAAMSNLAYLYQHGKGGAQDYAEAFKWYKKAAELGDGHSMSALGYIYSKGLGVKQDKSEARRWYRKGIEAGDNRKIIAHNLQAISQQQRVGSRRREGGRYSGGGAGDRSYVPAPVYTPPTTQYIYVRPTPGGTCYSGLPC